MIMLFFIMNLYKILNIDSNASEIEIKKAYLKLAKIYHPDKNNNDTSSKFQEINYAYNILYNEETRQKYNIMNDKSQNNFINFFKNIINSKITDDILKSLNIKIKNNIEDINTYLEKFNINQLLCLFLNNNLPKDNIFINSNILITSDSDTPYSNEECCYYFDEIPVIYQRYNSNNIFLNLDIELDCINKNKTRTLKLIRNIYNETKKYKFTFYTMKKFIVFNEGGDITNNSNGHLIIKLNLPIKYLWSKENIYYNHNISLYTYIYGLKLNLNIDKLYEIVWYPIRDGEIINLEKKIGKYNFFIILKINYNDTLENKKILHKHFNKT